MDETYSARSNARSGGRRSSVQTETAESRDRWLISYADLVTLLLAMFIVLFASADRQRATNIASALAAEFNEKGATVLPGGSGVLPGLAEPKTEGASHRSATFESARQKIDQTFAANKDLRDRAAFKITERGLVVSLTEAGFFAPADADIRADALTLLDSLAEALRDSDLPVRVEGHTDSLPIATTRYPSNWELSAARATTVLNRIVSRGIPANRLSVAGYADSRPVADNNSPEGRALNRRVDLVVLRGVE